MTAWQIEWTVAARADIRGFDRPTAMRIFEGLHRFASTGEGDVKQLTGTFAGTLRLRIGDYRVFFTPEGRILRILAVKHRSEAYR